MIVRTQSPPSFQFQFSKCIGEQVLEYATPLKLFKMLIALKSAFMYPCHWIINYVPHLTESAANYPTLFIVYTAQTSIDDHVIKISNLEGPFLSNPQGRG